jgi:hypothetical protein
MRKPEYLSPSAIKTYLASPEEYFLKYLTDIRPAKIPQSLPMAVGSAFDAEIKAFLTQRLFGTAVDLFEEQVEPQNRDAVRPIGKQIFENYRRMGALSNLLRLLQTAKYAPRFELELRGNVVVGNGDDKITVPLLCKPDLYFVQEFPTLSGTGIGVRHVIVDFKVNGYYSKASPKPGYINLLEMVPVEASAGADGKWTTKSKSHKDAILITNGGIDVNATPMDLYCEEWALQNSVAGWILGTDFLAGIEQLAFDASKPDHASWGRIPRIATYRGEVSKTYQGNLLKVIRDMWVGINTGTLLPSDKMEELNKVVANTTGPNAEYYRTIMARGY